MSRRLVDWVERDPRPPRSEIACRLARGRFWHDGSKRFIGTHPDWPDAAYFLDLEASIAHAFVLILSALPASERLALAEAYYEMRLSSDGDVISPESRTQLRMAAAIVLSVMDVIERPDICTERILDLLQGAAQCDDLTSVAATAIDEVRKTIARIRLDDTFEDPSDPRTSAALALAETLDPGGETVAFKEVLARAAWSVVRSRPRPKLMSFLLAADALVADSPTTNRFA